MLETGVVDAVLVPRALPDDAGYTQTLLVDPDELANTVPIAPTMPVHSAHILSDITPNKEARIAAVLKPCELRGAIELEKFLQTDMENVVTIGTDCAGTCEVTEYAALNKDERDELAKRMYDAYAADTDGEASVPRRTACTLCKYPAPVNADITVSLFGHVDENRMVFSASERFDETQREKLSIEWRATDESMASKRENRVAQERENRGSKRSDTLGELESRVSTADGLVAALSTCIRCHNCMNVCPICYCKECVFESSIFQHRPNQFINLAKRKGTARMPSDTMMFHLTRMSHMATSCVSCGMCESACPSDLPVGRLFSIIGGRLQDMFEYIPGIDGSEDPPVKVFKEQELQAESGS